MPGVGVGGDGLEPDGFEQGLEESGLLNPLRQPVHLSHHVDAEVEAERKVGQTEEDDGRQGGGVVGQAQPRHVHEDKVGVDPDDED